MSERRWITEGYAEGEAVWAELNVVIGRGEATEVFLRAEELLKEAGATSLRTASNVPARKER